MEEDAAILLVRMYGPSQALSVLICLFHGKHSGDANWLALLESILCMSVCIIDAEKHVERIGLKDVCLSAQGNLCSPYFITSLSQQRLSRCVRTQQLPPCIKCCKHSNRDPGRHLKSDLTTPSLYECEDCEDDQMQKKCFYTTNNYFAWLINFIIYFFLYKIFKL